MHSLRFSRAMALVASRKSILPAYRTGFLLPQAQSSHAKMFSTNNKNKDHGGWDGFAHFGQEKKESKQEVEKDQFAD